MMMPGTNVYLAPYSKTGELITREMLDEMLSAHDKNGVVRPRTVRQLDAAFKAMNVSYYVRHSMFALPMPRAITVASSKRIDVSRLNACVLNMMRAIMRGDVADGESVGAFVKHQLARYGYKHVAVCSRGDEFSQTRGEMIALGRLLKAQRKHDMPFDRQRLPALPSRRRDTKRRHVIGCCTRDRYVSICDDCKLTYGSDQCMTYRDDTAAKPCYADAEETPAYTPPQPTPHNDPTQDVVIGCGQSLKCHTSENPAHFMFCRDCSYTYSDAPDSKCRRYRAVYSLIGPRHIIQAYEVDERKE